MKTCGSCYAGILLMHDPERIERCDECGLFDTDQAAAEAVRALLKLLQHEYEAVHGTIADAFGRLNHEEEAPTVGLEDYRHVVGSCYATAYGHHSGPRFCGDPRCKAAAATPSPREREVLGHVSAGLDNPKIAALLGITERTVKAHMTALYNKFGADNRMELMLAGQKFGKGKP